MSYKPEQPGIKPVLGALAQAAERGAIVDFMVDAYAFLINNAAPGSLFFHTTLPQRLRGLYAVRKQTLQTLEAAGVRCTIIHVPRRRFTNPFSGRSHIKLAIVGDYTYTGGCNLNPRDHIDVMVGWQDQKSSDWLYDLMQQTIRQGSVTEALAGKDKSFQIDSSTKLLIDSGIRNQSLIYEEALGLMDGAQRRLFMTCQYFPDGRTTEHLQDAYKRGVGVEIMYGNPAQHLFPHNLLHHGVKWREKRRRPASFFAHELPKGGQSLHAKILVSEHAAMVGSHNYVPAGVRWGTAEIALFSTDVQLRNQLIRAVKA